MPLDTYVPSPVAVMQRVSADEERGLHVPAYAAIAAAAALEIHQLRYVERFQFYELARGAFAIVQTDDRSLYANVVLQKGVL
jgi:L-fucose mutarotase